MAAPVITGQLWYATNGGDADTRIVHVNSDGSSQTTNIDNSPGVDPIPLTSSGGALTIVDVGVDTVAGVYFFILQDRLGQNSQLWRGVIGSSAAPTRVDTFDAADTVNAMQIDAVNRKIYIGYQESTGTLPDATGIRAYSYDATGALSGGAFVVTATNDGRGQEDSLEILMPRDLALDPTMGAAGTLFYSEMATGGYIESVGLYRVDIATHTSTQLVIESQFPDGGGNGFIYDVEVDRTTDRVYFSTQSYSPYDPAHPASAAYVAGQNAIWWIAENATNGTATKVTLTGANSHFYPGGMTFDQSTRQLYVESQENGGSSADNIVYVFQLNATGDTATLVTTITPAAFIDTVYATIQGLTFVELPVLGLTGTSTAAVEGASSATDLTSALTLTDDGGYLKGAKVQITGGTFSSNENSTADDHLGIGGKVSSGVVSGTSITFSWNSATETLTLTGVDTIAHYQSALDQVVYWATGDNPTNYGANTNRTLTWTVDDGTPSISAGSSNSGTTLLNITGSNDAPVNTAPSTISGTEDGAGIAVTGLQIADADNDPATQSMTVTLSVTKGVITLRTDVASGLDAGHVSGNGAATVVLTGTQNQINATLAASNGLTYAFNGDVNGTDTLTVLTSDGLASDSDPYTITITAVNDAPVVGGDGTEVLSAGLEDTPGTAATVSSIFSAQFNDLADQVSDGSSANTFAGVAVVSNGSSAAGDWQYNNGGGWTPIGAASTSVAVLLNAATQIRFTPATDYNGAAPTLTVRLIDSSGSAFTDGATANTTTNGGVTRYSTGTVTLDQTIAAVNDAPTLTGGATVTLTSIGEDSGASASATVTSLFASHFSDAKDGSTSTLAGVAVVANGATTQGVYQYLDGATWTDIPTVATNNAFVLAAGTEVRFLPAANYSGTAPDLTVKLIETSVATVTTGDRPDLTTTGGSTVYSAAAMTLSIEVTPTNDAPVATGSATLTDIVEGAADPAGATVSSLFGANFSDPDSGDVLGGVAITHNGAASAQGLWQYKVAGTWVTIVSPDEAHALYLPTTALLRFLPNADFNGSPPSLQAHLIDSTATGLVAEAEINVGVNGGQTHYSTGVVTLSTSVTAVNDAPVVSGDGTEVLSAGLEDTPGTGATVSSIFGTQFNDLADQVSGGSSANTFAGVAVVSSGSSAAGDWEYNNGGVWTPIGAASTSAAVLLNAATQIRFTPATDYNGAAPTLTVRLIDSSGSAFTDGATADTTTNGGATRYSTATVTLDQTIAAVNDAPTLTGGAAVTLTSIGEDAGASASATVTSLFASHFSDAADGSASTLAGVAVIANGATTQGAYQYLNGSTWTDIPTVATNNAFVLAAGTEVRFLPAANYSGTAPDLTVKLIESSVATVTTGDRPDLTTTGGSTVYSAAAMTLSIEVTPTNDAPVATGSATLTDIVEGAADPAGATVSSLFGANFSDPDSGDVLGGVAIIHNGAASAQGLWQYKIAGTWVTIGSPDEAHALYLPTTALLRFLPNADFSGSPPGLQAHLVDSTATGLVAEAEINVGVNGGQTHYSTGVVTLSTSVTAVNDAPVVAPTATPVNATEQTAATLLGALTVSDADLDARNSGLGDYAGASFTVQRASANVADTFGFSGGSFTVSGGNLQVGGLTVATFTSTGGVLTISFTSSGGVATTAAVTDILHHITYTNTSDAPPPSVSLDYALNDGGSQGTGGALSGGGSVTVNITAVNDLPTGAVTATGTTTENETLTANTSALVDGDGLGVLNYEWQRGSGSTFTTIAGATASTYVLGDVDVGKQVRVVVTYTDAGGAAESVTGAPTATIAGVNDPHTGTVTISGATTEDQTLTAITTALADIDGLGTLHYEWQRGSGSTFTTIGGATAATYALGDADVGQTVRVRVTYTDLQGFSESELSGATGTIVNINDAPTGSVTITGSAVVGETLRASNSLADADGLGTVGYQWKADGANIVGATGASLILTDAQVGKVISVVASYTDLHGTPESVVSAVVTAAVVDPPPPPPTTTVIDGAPVEVTKTINPNGTITQTTTIGSVTPAATNETADIPLFTENGQSLLSVSAPIGFSMTIVGNDKPEPASNVFENLVTAIRGAGGDTGQTGAGGDFLNTLTSDSRVLVQTVTPTLGSAPGTNIPLTFEGSPPATGVYTALVLDVSNLPRGTIVNLQNIDFVTIIGESTIGGGEGSQVVFGDDSIQIIILGADDDILHGGGGNDTVGSKGGNDKIYGDAGDDTLFGGEGNDLMDGGTGNDTVLMGGNLKDYIFTHNGAGLLATSFEGDDTIINVETLKMTDGATVTDLNKLVAGTTSVAVMAYEFFTGKTPTAVGLEYLLHAPDAVNASDLSDAYYTKFSVDNRYINFAINLASPQGQAHAWFEANYGSLNFEQSITKAYKEIFGVTLTNDKMQHLLYDEVGGNMTRLHFFELYAGSADGAKAGIIGWLLAAAVLEDTGRYAAANTAFLNDFADGNAQLNVDLVAVYGDGHAWGTLV